MLRLTSSARRSSAVPRSSRTRTTRQQFAFGGVAFELLSERSTPLAPPIELLRFCVHDASALAIADVVGALHREPGARSAPTVADEVRFRIESEGSIDVESATISAQLKRIGRKRYVLSAHVAQDRDAMLALLRGVSAAVVHHEGGVVVHGAGAEIDGRAIVFIGPSGAGKSTAVELTRGARCFAFDHVAIVPSPQGWLAWGLPGGTPLRAALASGVVYPLAAMLRVRQATTGESRLSELDRAEALFALRESVEWADDSPDAERAYLQAACELSSQIAVQSITTVLGSATNAALAPLLAGSGSKSEVRG